MLKTALIAILAIATSAKADNLLPDKPQPRTRVANVEYWAQVGAMAGAWTADTVTTAQWIHNCPSCTEAGTLFTGSRSAPRIMGAWAAVDIGAALVSYEWKLHVRNRYLHPLWRVPLMMRTEAHSQAAWHNARMRY